MSAEVPTHSPVQQPQGALPAVDSQVHDEEEQGQPHGHTSACAAVAADAFDVLAYVNGQPFTDTPKDLYIPPEALEVILESFEGPLDLLLYLIRKNNLDVLDVAVADVTKQYMEYVEVMKQFRLELAADYLVMAALLSEIKSRCLLPRQAVDEEDEGDPRQELIRRLQEYERFKTAAEEIEALPRVDRDIQPVTLAMPKVKQKKAFPTVAFSEVLLAFREVLVRSDLTQSHHVEREKLSTRERMADVLDRLRQVEYLLFPALFNEGEGRAGVIVTFLATLELLKEGLIDLVQHEPFGVIYVAARTQLETTSQLEIGVSQEFSEHELEPGPTEHTRLDQRLLEKEQAAARPQEDHQTERQPLRTSAHSEESEALIE